MELEIKNNIPEIHSPEERSELCPAPDLAASLMAISERCSSLPDFCTLNEDEILGYTDDGAFFLRDSPPDRSRPSFQARKPAFYLPRRR